MPTWRILCAYVESSIDDWESVRAGLDELARDDFRGLLNDMHLIPALTGCALASYWLRDVARARSLYALLEPYANRHTKLGYGVATFGSIRRYLGLLATVLSERADDPWHARAVGHLTDALAENRRAGLRVFTAWTALELSTALRQSPVEAEWGRAMELQASAISSAEALGMRLLLRRVREAEALA
jgi:hypothetical protein